MNKFREISPERTFKGIYKNYRSYKPYLREDFKGRCGYTDCPDTWFGGPKCFHIDHFLPKSKFINLINEYTNLVYSCSYINILKTDDFANMIDPCSSDFDKAFFRDRHGYICANPSFPDALIMHKKLKLGLERYRIVWTLEMLKNTLQKLNSVVRSCNTSMSPQQKSETLEIFVELTDEFFKYFEYLGHKL